MEIKSIECFPKVTTRTLAGRKIMFPDDIKGQQTFVVMVFEDQGRYEQAQSEATVWTVFWQTHLASQVNFYEIAMMNGQYGVLSFWIDAAMRTHLDRDKHDQVTCFYGDKKFYQRQLDITNLTTAQVFLLDKKGHILFKTSGVPTDGDKQHIMTLLHTNP